MNQIILLYRISIASEISPEWDIPLRWNIPPHMKRPLEKYFETQLYDLIKSKGYDPYDEVQRQLLMFSSQSFNRSESSLQTTGTAIEFGGKKLSCQLVFQIIYLDFLKAKEEKGGDTILTADRLKDIAEIPGALEAPPDITVQRLEQK